jgi:hypothetical protein
MTTTNGQLPPAPPAPSANGHDLTPRVVRLESQIKTRDIDSLAAQVVVLENRVYQQERLRDGLYESMYEMASALMRMQRQVDTLERDRQELWRKVQAMENQSEVSCEH